MCNCNCGCHQNKSKEYCDTRDCENCGKEETPHVFYDSGHERDSSGDWYMCLNCGYATYGRSSSGIELGPDDLDYLLNYRKKYKSYLT